MFKRNLKTIVPAIAILAIGVYAYAQVVNKQDIITDITNLKNKESQHSIEVLAQLDAIKAKVEALQINSTTTIVASGTIAIIPTPAPAHCRAPRYYKKSILPGEEKYLTCGIGSLNTVFQMTIPDEGYALASFKVAVKNNSNYIRGYGASVNVGSPVYSEATGENICGGEWTNPYRQFLGYGKIGPTNNTIKVNSYTYGDACSNSDMIVWSGAFLEVWVEDAAPECQKKDIVFNNYYTDVASRNYGNPLVETYNWQNNYTPIASTTVAKNPNRTNFRTLTTIESSPTISPNTTCGAAGNKVYLKQVVNNSTAGEQSRPIPASQGQGHRLLDLDILSSIVNLPSLVQVRTEIKKDFYQMTTTGGCCGDSATAIIQY
jgi:hypothetical protein